MNVKQSPALGVLLASASLISVTAVMGAPPDGYRLAWADEFNGTTMDVSKWNYRGLGKRRQAINVTNAVAVADGLLTITTYSVDGKHYTGMIGTEGKFERSFGYYEARIRFDDSPGMWSAFWSQTPTMGSHIGDPAQAGMEIDILEHRAVDKNGKNIAGTIQHTLHWDGYGPDHQSRAQRTDDLDLDRGFHVCGFEWTPEQYRFFIDGKLTWSSGPVSKRPQYLILSSEVQDNGWAGRIPAEGYGSLAHSRTRMAVDYVRYYAPDGR